MSLSARFNFRKPFTYLLLLVLIFQTAVYFPTSAVHAQVLPPAATPTPTSAAAPGLGQGQPTGGQWKYDPVVTEVGKNAERARELLYWTFSHPARNRAQVLAKMWSVSRNIVYLFFLLVLAAGGIGYITAKRQGRIGPIFSGVSPPFFGFELPSFIFKVAALLVYVTFSYVFVLGLIEFAQIMQNFFIKNLGGCNLFNINFGKATECIFPGKTDAEMNRYREVVLTMEKNYKSFAGYRDVTPANQEMASTSLFFVRLTSLTYNVMSIMLILRDVILWFLLIVSPFLALFMPFIFVRNIGWIWIGTFLQWLFYGPLLALFVVGLVRVWEAGIPYGFDFSRVGVCNTAIDATLAKPAVPYPTSINILWGGPAQTLGQCNSANYIDTYAEYVVALIMLWSAILLPWLLLRIFRDYCCDILRQNQATLQAIYNQLRKPPAPPGAPAPKPGEKGVSRRTEPQRMQLPFRRVRKEEEERETTKRVARRVSIEDVREITRKIKQVSTKQITKSLNVSMESLRDVARTETNTVRQQEVREQLNKIANPAQITNIAEREEYTRVKTELATRAKQGDEVAARVFESAQKPRPAAIIRRVPRALPAVVTASQIRQTVQETQVAENEVVKIVRMLSQVSKLPAEQQVVAVAKQTQVPEERVERVLMTLAKTSPVRLKREEEETVAPPKVTVEDYEEVKSMWVKHYRSSAVPQSDKIKTRDDWLQQDMKKIANAINLLQSKQEEMKEQGLAEVEKLLPFLLLGGFTGEETLVYLKAKLEAAKQVSEEAEKKEEEKEEEEKVEVERAEEEEEEKTMEAEKAKEMNLPEDKEGNKENTPG